MKKVLVIGGGRVGSVIARDLMTEYEVVVSDVANLDHLSNQYGLDTRQLNLLDIELINEYVDDFDLVVNALPGQVGFGLLEKLIKSKKNVVDISFFSEDPYLLEDTAKDRETCVVFDCGVAPGLCNIILGHHMHENVKSYSCYVGGLPFERNPPFEYKAPFSPSDVIEEYVRPARLRVNGKEVIREALSELELIDFKGIAQLEAFNTDGLRSLLKTNTIPNLKEKTLRYPGHANLMKSFRDIGLFSWDFVELEGQKVRPIELTSKLLFEEWKLNDDDDEFTLMKVIVETEKEIHEYSVFDKKDKVNNMSSMSRTTGFTCTSVCRLILDGKYFEKGIIAPEIIGQNPECFESIIRDLENRNVRIQHEVKKI